MALLTLELVIDRFVPILGQIYMLDGELLHDAQPLARRLQPMHKGWLREGDVRLDPANAKYFHRMRAIQLEARESEGAWVPAFELAYRAKGKGAGVRFHARDAPLRIADIECSQHGDKGLNGARASLTSFAKLGERVIVGHSHTPGIRDGAYQVGVVGSYDQGYNAGPSSWRHASALIYANGKRTLIFAVDGRWRA